MQSGMLSRSLTVPHVRHTRASRSAGRVVCAAGRTGVMEAACPSPASKSTRVAGPPAPRGTALAQRKPRPATLCAATTRSDRQARARARPKCDRPRPSKGWPVRGAAGGQGSLGCHASEASGPAWETAVPGRACLESQRGIFLLARSRSALQALPRPAPRARERPRIASRLRHPQPDGYLGDWHGEIVDTASGGRTDHGGWQLWTRVKGTAESARKRRPQVAHMLPNTKPK